MGEEHVLWIFQHAPASPVAGWWPTHLSRKVSPEAYARGRAVWLDHLKRKAGNIAVLANAAQFFGTDEPAMARRIVARIEHMRPDAVRWPQELGLIFKQHRMYRQALRCYERARALERSAIRKAQWLPKLAWMAFKAELDGKIERYAHEALKAAREGALRQHARRVAIHAHSILGRLALRKGNVEEAEKQLLASADGLRGRSFLGVNRHIALPIELVNRGQFDAVRRFRQLCVESGREPWSEDTEENMFSAVRDGHMIQYEDLEP